MKPILFTIRMSKNLKYAVDILAANANTTTSPFINKFFKAYLLEEAVKTNNQNIINLVSDALKEKGYYDEA